MTTEHYRGGCQCGAVSYEVDVSIDDVLTCNCSRCQPMGFVLAFAAPSDFTLHAGEDALTEYRFNEREIRHLFCTRCGVESFAYGHLPDGAPVVAINVNCLEGVEPRSLSPRHVDGRRL